jgi:uncharacterized protein YraI
MSRRSTFLLILFTVVLVVGVTLTNAQEFGTNWTASFYNTPDLTGAVVATQTVSAINFNWGEGSPVPGAVNVDNFSARFTGVQTFQDGTYTFTIASDDGARVLIDGQVVYDQFVGRPLTTDTFSRTMTAGPHTITVEYFDGIGQAIIQFQWVLSGAAATVGPTPTPGPTNTPAPTALPAIPPGALTATVIRAPVLNVRAAPFIGAPRVGRILRGQTYAVIGRNPDATWFLLQLSGFQGWAFGYYLFINGNEFNAPVVSAFTLAGVNSPTGVVAQTQAVMKLRAEPTVASQQIGRIPWGEIMPVIGRRGDWWQVVFRGTTGWVYSPFLRIVEGDLNNVPWV